MAAKKKKKRRSRIIQRCTMTRELFASIEAAHVKEGHLIERLRGTWQVKR